MTTKMVKVLIEHGVHMRPASEIMKIALSTSEEVTLKLKSLEVSAKSLMSIVLLLATKGSVIEVSSNDAEVVDKIEKILQTKKI